MQVIKNLVIEGSFIVGAQLVLQAAELSSEGNVSGILFNEPVQFAPQSKYHVIQTISYYKTE